MSQSLPTSPAVPEESGPRTARGVIARAIQATTMAREAQLRYLSQSVRLEEAVNPHLIRLTVILVSLAVCLFIAWSAVTNVDEVARGPGEVVPSGYERSIQHLDGGLVGGIFVKEGEYVTKGQPLVELDTAGLQQDLAIVKEKMRGLGVQAERYRAYLERREPNFASFGTAAEPRIAQQARIFQAMVTARNEQSNVLKEQIEQKRLNIGIIDANRTAADSALAYNADLLARRKSLFEKGLIAFTQLGAVENEVNRIRASIIGLTDERLRAEREVQEYSDRLTASGSMQREELYNQLHAIETDVGQNAELARKIEDRISRLVMRAPSNGVIKVVNVNTIGSVVQPGQTIVSLVPMDEALVVQANLAPSDIGHVRLGQTVQLKVSAYNFARYGWLSGRLDFISANTFAGPTGERYYRARVTLDQRHLGPDPTRNLIMPGMTVTVEIITGKKTILAYLLKPIHVALNTAFSER
jgi:membrane fusion protein, adhesin transport system